MGLVDYSDSETSDVEGAPPAPAPAPKTTAKPEKPKLIDRSEPRKIKVDLPTVQPEPTQADEEERPVKKARTAGAFSGFNSLLPAPKRAAQSGPKPGVSLKTSSEAAFSREAPSASENEDTNGRWNENGEGVVVGATETSKAEEPKIVGKTTKFKPLSVANKKKPPKKAKPIESELSGGLNGNVTKEPVMQKKEEVAVQETAPPLPKPKKSLFSVPQAEEDGPAPEASLTYESMTTQPDGTNNYETSHQQPQPQPSNPSNPNSLQSLASDLNLTPAQRRQLFGRDGKGGDISISHFNMDNEYAANEQLRQAGEVVEHRAVKAIAPGKHSLQQLVNNAKSQQEAMEDKWAEGRRERGGMSGGAGK